MPNERDETEYDKLIPDDVRIDDYFARLSKQARGMPDAAREDRLRELRYHLASLIAAVRQAGVPESEAVTVALVQMGDADQVGRTMMRQWRVSHSRMDAAAFYITAAFNLMALAWLLKVGLFNSLDWGTAIALASVAPVAVGIVSGVYFRRVALRAILISAFVTVVAAVGTMVALNTILYDRYYLSPNDRSHSLTYVAGIEASILCVYLLGWLPLECLCVALGRRFRRPMQIS